ncbi:MAG: hypothetical protein HWD58_02430 [Bacteroidota bacterium]|nr:MAG: hypothetical protein HWD58_02430 [Bacteroidota bacterium]
MYIENNSIYDDASIVNPFGANTWAYGIDINCILPGNATPQTLTAYTSFPHHIIGNYIGSTQPWQQETTSPSSIKEAMLSLSVLPPNYRLYCLSSFKTI